jgi:hypothetical protein
LLLPTLQLPPIPCHNNTGFPLPLPLRRYIHDLETNVVPAGMVREDIILRAERD